MSEHELGGQPREKCGYPSGHSTDCPKNNGNEQNAQEKKPRKLTPEEALETTIDVFKEALNPKTAIKKVKDFFGK